MPHSLPYSIQTLVVSGVCGYVYPHSIQLFRDRIYELKNDTRRGGCRVASVV